MAFLSSLLAATPGPTADFWYQPIAGVTASGLKVDAEGAKKLSAWYRGRDILATALAMLPLNVYERLPEDRGATVARQHPLHDALHRKPNVSDDAFGWKRQAMYDLIDHGWAYSALRIGQTWTLERLNPWMVTPSKRPDGAWQFAVRDTAGQTRVLTQDDVFYLRAGDGAGVLASARESLGLAVVQDRYAARVFGRGTLSSGVLEPPGMMKDEQIAAFARSWTTAEGDWHLPKVIPPGAKWHPSDAMTPDDAQMILSRKFAITDIARWLGLPPHMLGDLDRATFSNIEHQGQEFVTYALGPWLSLWEFGINDQLILQPNRFYAEFVRDALVRGDIAARWQAYQVAVTTGTVTRNEVRRKENLNALPGLDEPIEPAHLTGKSAPDPEDDLPSDPASESAQPEDDPAQARAMRMAEVSAARVLRKEVAALQKLAVRHAADGDAFAGAVAEFYQKHVALVGEALAVSPAVAASYCAGQAQQALTDWVSACETWQTTHYAAGLAMLALEAA